jgi:hypothetical protein
LSLGENFGVYLRRVGRSKAGAESRHWALVESRRTARGPRQQVVAYLGDVSEELRQGVALAASKTPEQLDLFKPNRPEWVEIDFNSVRVERARSFGGAWLALQLMSDLGLTAFLESHLGESRADIPWHLTAQVLVAHRLLDPSSELSIAESGYEKTALADLLGVPVDKVRGRPALPGPGPAAASQGGARETS